MKARYTVIDGEVLAQTRNGVRHHYVPDPAGNVVALFDTNLAKTDTFDYWPYGEQKSRTGTTETPFRFRGALGYYRDTDRWTYVGARHYRPDHGRWQTPKAADLMTGTSPFAFAGNDPMSAQDMGRQVIDEDLAKCLAKCAGKKRDELAKCLRQCLENKFWKFCSRIVCMVKPEECPQGCDPCDKKNCNYQQAGCDCCDTKYQCCLLRNPTGLGPAKCLKEHDKCFLVEDCITEVSHCDTLV